MSADEGKQAMPSPKPLIYIATTYTGGDCCFFLRADLFPGVLLVDGGVEFNRDIGCLDAPRTLPGGATHVEDGPVTRTILQRYVPRA